MSVLALTVIGTFDVLTAAQTPALWSKDQSARQLYYCSGRLRTYKTPIPSSKVSSNLFCKLNCNFHTMSTGIKARAKSKNAQ